MTNFLIYLVLKWKREVLNLRATVQKRDEQILLLKNNLRLERNKSASLEKEFGLSLRGGPSAEKRRRGVECSTDPSKKCMMQPTEEDSNQTVQEQPCRPTENAECISFLPSDDEELILKWLDDVGRESNE